MTGYGPKIDHGKPNQRRNVTVTSIRSSTLVQTKQNTCIYNRMRRFKIVPVLKSWSLLMRAVSISIRSSMCFSKQEVPCFLGFNNRHGVRTRRKSFFWCILHDINRTWSTVGGYVQLWASSWNPGGHSEVVCQAKEMGRKILKSSGLELLLSGTGLVWVQSSALQRLTKLYPEPWSVHKRWDLTVTCI